MEENNLMTRNKKDLSKQIQGDGLLKAEAFIKDTLAVEPISTEIKSNPFANNSKYIPISMIEDKLDEVFFGAWEVKDFQYQAVANELIGSIQLRVFHPVFQTWIERTGAGAVMVQMKSEKNGGDGRITNIENKILNTLVKDFPHLKSVCIANAAKSLGKWFGRDLNRKDDMKGEYESIYTNEIEYQNKSIDFQQKLRKCSNMDDIGMLWNSLEKEEQDNTKIKKLFTARKAELKANL